MKKNYILNIRNFLSFGKIDLHYKQGICNAFMTFRSNYAHRMLMVLMIFCISFAGYGQKIKTNNQPPTNQDVSFTSCIKDMGNGMYKAYFGYTNPTNKTIIVDQKDSYIYLNDHIIDDESDDDQVNHQNGVEKLPGLTTFLPGTHNKAFFVVFNASGHAKWTVIFKKNSATKIRANSGSSICQDNSVIFPVFGGAGKSFTPIGAELTALATGNANGNNGEAPSKIIFQLNDEDEVLIEIVPKNNRMSLVLGLLQNTFGRQYNTDASLTDFIVDPLRIIHPTDPSKNLATIDVWFPISQLLLLNDYPNDLNFSRPLYLPLGLVGTVDSQGDGAMLTNIVRESFVLRDASGTPMQVDGSGVKVGVISDSYDKANLGESQATADVGSKDLPGIAGIGNPNYPTPVEVLKDYPYGKASDEGRAMLQIVHDVAPGAQLGFRTGVLSPRDMALAINDFALKGYDVVSDDVTYPMAPFYEDGEIAQAIKDFVEVGGIYTSSSGNFAKNAQQGNFTNSSNAIPLPSFLPANTKAHVFGNPGSNPIMQEITVAPGTYFIVLQTDEDLASQNNSMGAGTDIDIYVLNAAGEPLVNTNRVNLFGDSVEAMVFQAVANATAYIMITSANGPAPEGLPFRYIAFRANGLNIIGNPGAPTVSGHAMTNEAITVGAVNHTTAQNPVPETFSSFAGPLTNSTSLSVDISAPDGVEVNVPGFSNFLGTSAAVPHVAGAAALLLSTSLAEEVSSASWYPNGLPVPVLELFQTNAVPITDKVDQAGSGFLDALAAFKQIGAQTAVLTDVTLESNPEEGFPIVVRLTGKYFPIPVDTGESEVPVVPLVKLVNGEVQIPLAVTSFSETEIVVTVPSFTGNPNLVVYTPPNTQYSPAGVGGGDSNPEPIFNDGTIAIKIKAVDVDIKYGQAYEDKFDFTVEGLSREDFDLLDLPDIIFTTSVTNPIYPGVTNYGIIPSFDVDNATPGQLATLQENYLIAFEDGVLKVTKNDLTITPDPEDITYGDAITLTLKYTHYDQTDIASVDDFDTWIREAHSADFYVDNTLALINRFNAVVNTLVFDELQGGSWMATEETLLNINNRFNAVVNGMDLINMDVQDMENYLVNRFNAVVNTELNRFNAVVNGEGLLNGDVFFNNRFNAVVNGTTLEGDENDFAKVFAILDLGDDAQDVPPDPDDVGIAKFYAMNMITGINVTGTGEGQIPEHLSFPGAFLAPIAANFNITYQSSTIKVGRATLIAETNDLLIKQGEIPDASAITSMIGGYVYGEDTASVFPNGIPYSFFNLQGHEYQVGDVGVFFITIMKPQNYDIDYSKIGKLYVTPADSGLKNIRTYLDCVEFDPNGPAGYQYTANFRYVNPNSKTIYVLQGADNNLSGAGANQIIGELPVVFLPGQGKFKIQFNGSQLKWTLTTLDNAHKTATSSNASSSSNRCGSSVNELENPSYVLMPNPVQDELTILKNVSAGGELHIFDLYGTLYYQSTFGNGFQELKVNMSTYPDGMYIVRFTTNQDVKAYIVIKN